MKYILTLAALSALIAMPAVAGQCGDRAEAVKQLTQDYHEHPVAVGIAKDGDLIELYATANGSTWTILATSPGGVSCLIEAGGDLSVRKEIVKGPEA